MTVKEFWRLKYGDIVSDTFYNRVGKVVKRKVYDECSGFIIGRNTTIDLKTGRKFLEITLQCESGYNYYYQSNSTNIKNLVKVVATL